MIGLLQFGYLFSVGDMRACLNVKGYAELMSQIGRMKSLALVLDRGVQLRKARHRSPWHAKCRKDRGLRQGS